MSAARAAPRSGGEPVYLKADVPPGRSGEWVVEHFTQEDRGAVDQPLSPQWMRYRPGEYTRLKKGPVTFMTDLYEEWWTQRRAIAEAARRGGHVLVTGLGLGLVVDAMFRQPESAVERVTVIEQSADVIRLVADSLEQRYPGRVEIIEADALRWDPPADARFSVGWHDIWPNPYDATITAEMDAVERRYAACCDWQACWAREWAESRRES